MTFHPVHGQQEPDKPKPQFHPALGYIPQEGKPNG